MWMLFDPSSSLLLGLTSHFVQNAHGEEGVIIAASQYKIILVHILGENSAAMSSAVS